MSHLARAREMQHYDKVYTSHLACARKMQLESFGRKKSKGSHLAREREMQPKEAAYYTTPNTSHLARERKIQSLLQSR